MKFLVYLKLTVLLYKRFMSMQDKMSKDERFGFALEVCYLDMLFYVLFQSRCSLKKEYTAWVEDLQVLLLLSFVFQSTQHTKKTP